MRFPSAFFLAVGFASTLAAADPALLFFTCSDRSARGRCTCLLAALLLGFGTLPNLATAQPIAPGAAFAQLLADERAFVYAENPLRATREGIRDHDHRLPEVTPAANARQFATDETLLARLRAIPRAELSAPEQVSYDLFDFMVASRLALGRFNEWRTPLNSDSGFHANLTQLHSSANPQTTRDYENYIARLRDVPRYFAENITNMRQGIRDGWTLPAAVLPGILDGIKAQQIDAPEASPFYRPFAKFPATVPEGERARLTAAGRNAIVEAVKPAYAGFQRFFAEEYQPAARATLGISHLPAGREYYAELVRYFTTLPDATAEQIHAIGLREVARIRGEMDEVIAAAKFRGTFPEFLHFLRTDPQFHAASAQHLLHYAAWITREIDAEMPRFFGRIPRTPYSVKPVPAELAPNYTAGRYNSGPMGAAGTYWVNTYALKTRPLYALPALTLHEAAPGHHTQVALARELTDVPRFRLNFYLSAFGEGWALYAEKLGKEMGVYHTPYEDFGRLSYEMWRACRLVVDTGIHAMDWSRQQAIDYLAANTALSHHEVRTEIDRYIAWPGQALSYKMGELTIVRLRQRAETALGANFDLRSFHDAVLEHGTVTMPMLERRIDAYMAARVKRTHEQ